MEAQRIADLVPNERDLRKISMSPENISLPLHQPDFYSVDPHLKAMMLTKTRCLCWVYREKVPQLRALAALAKDQGSVPSSHMTSVTPVSGDLCPLLASESTACTQCTAIHAGRSTPVHKIQTKII